MTEEKKPSEKKEGIITESIVAAVRKSSADEKGNAEEVDTPEAAPPEVRTEEPAPAPEETDTPVERDIPKAVPIKVRTEIPGSRSKEKKRQGKLSPLLIMALIIAVGGYYIYTSSSEKIDSAPVFEQEVEEITPVPQLDQEVIEKEIIEPIHSQEATENIPPASVPAQEVNKEIDHEPILSQETAAPVPDLTQEATEKIDLEPVYNREADTAPVEDGPSESPVKAAENNVPVVGERFIVHVAAWETEGYAVQVKEKIMSVYPNAIIIFENDHYIVMVPNIVSREEAQAVSDELAVNLDVSPLIYIQQRRLSE